MYAYIDESGDTGLSKKSSKNFILSAVLVKDENILARIARKVFKLKVLNKRKSNQLHAKQDTDGTRKAILKMLNTVDYEAYYVNDKNYLKALEILIGFLASQKVNTIYLAMRDSSKKTINAIDQIAKNLNVEVIKTVTQKEKGLQIADFVSWSIFRYVEFGDDLYYLRLKTREIKKV